MRKIVIILLFLMMNLSVSSYGSDKTRYKVIKINDGDTFYIDFNKNNIPEKDEKVRVNGIDAFETKLNPAIKRQMYRYYLTQKETIGLGYFGTEFAKNQLLNKYVLVKYTAETETDDNNRKLVSVYYNCDLDGNNCKNYEEEILKAGYAVVYTKSNLADSLKKYENLNTIRKNANLTHKMYFLIFDKNRGEYHKVNCKYSQGIPNAELVAIPKQDYKKASCCHKENK